MLLANQAVPTWVKEYAVLTLSCLLCSITHRKSWEHRTYNMDALKGLWGEHVVRNCAQAEDTHELRQTVKRDHAYGALPPMPPPLAMPR